MLVSIKTIRAAGWPYRHIEFSRRRIRWTMPLSLHRHTRPRLPKVFAVSFLRHQLDKKYYKNCDTLYRVALLATVYTYSDIQIHSVTPHIARYGKIDHMICSFASRSQGIHQMNRLISSDPLADKRKSIK